MKLITQLTLCLVIGFSLQVKAALVARDLDGNFANGHEAVYDTVLNITWMADTNLAASNTFGVAGITDSGFGDEGWMALGTANTWITAMNVVDDGAGYLGVNTWRLPKVEPVNGIDFSFDKVFSGGSDIGYQINAPVHPEYNPYGLSEGIVSSELAYHYHNNFGALGSCFGEGDTRFGLCLPPSIVGFKNAADPANNKLLFENILNYSVFWTSTLASLERGNFSFGFNVGAQGIDNPDEGFGQIWAVADGDVGAAMVPLPSAFVLFLSGVAALQGCRWKRELFL